MSNNNNNSPMDSLAQLGDTNEAKKILYNLNEMDSRSCVICAASLLDTYMQHRLESEFISMNPKSQGIKNDMFDSPVSPLQSFPAKARLCYAMGLYGDVSFHDLITINKIRREFAHKLIDKESGKTLSFEEPWVQARCKELKIAYNDVVKDMGLSMEEVTHLSQSLFVVVTTTLLSGMARDAIRRLSEYYSMPKGTRIAYREMKPSLP